MNRRQKKKLLKKQEGFIVSFCKSYKELKELDRQYHAFVISSRRAKVKDDTGELF